jgi:hypothetical protein
MSDTDDDTIAPRTGDRIARYAKFHPPTIELADDIAELRCVFGNRFGAVDRTVARMRLPTIYVNGVPYILRGKALKIIAERGLRNAEPKPRIARRGPYLK